MDFNEDIVPPEPIIVDPPPITNTLTVPYSPTIFTTYPYPDQHVTKPPPPEPPPGNNGITNIYNL